MPVKRRRLSAKGDAEESPCKVTPALRREKLRPGVKRGASTQDADDEAVPTPESSADCKPSSSGVQFNKPDVMTTGVQPGKSDVATTGENPAPASGVGEMATAKQKPVGPVPAVLKEKPTQLDMVLKNIDVIFRQLKK